MKERQFFDSEQPKIGKNLLSVYDDMLKDIDSEGTTVV